MNVPELIQEALALRHPFVSCLWEASRQRYILVYRRDGKAAILRVLETEEGHFLHPDLWNTVVWLNERDCAWMDNYARRERFLKMLDQTQEKQEQIKRANLSDMIRMGLAPKLRHEMRKLRRA